MFRKNPETQNKWSLDNVVMCARRQYDILHKASDMLMPGGILVYSTCTFAPEENEQVIEKFLLNHSEFEIVDPSVNWEGIDRGRPEWTLGNMQDISKTLRVWPHKVKGEGHFIAVLKKKGVSGTTGRRQAERTNEIGKKDYINFYMNFAKQFLNCFPDNGLSLFGDHLYIIPEGMPSLEKLKVLRPGWHLGTFKKNRFEPSHALALTLNAHSVKQWINLNSSSADIQAYLRGEPLPCNKQKGWVLVMVDGYSIGWGKASDGVLKNHYPKGLRWIS